MPDRFARKNRQQIPPVSKPKATVEKVLRPHAHSVHTAGRHPLEKNGVFSVLLLCESRQQHSVPEETIKSDKMVARVPQPPEQRGLYRSRSRLGLANVYYTGAKFHGHEFVRTLDLASK